MLRLEAIAHGLLTVVALHGLGTGSLVLRRGLGLVAYGFWREKGMVPVPCLSAAMLHSVPRPERVWVYGVLAARMAGGEGIAFSKGRAPSMG